MNKRDLTVSLMVVINILFMSTQVSARGDLPGNVTSATFKNPPNEFRLVQYQLTDTALKDYPSWGIGGYMGFFYKNLYQQGPEGPKQIGPLVDAAHKSGSPVWLADDWGYPSGMAGGLVVAENPDFEVRSLVMLTQKGNGENPINWSLPKDLHDIVSATLYPVKGGGIDHAAGKRLKPSKSSVSGKGLNGAWELRVFARFTRIKRARGTMKQFGHTGRYPDLMIREAVARFIANMHEPILEQISNPGKKVEGFYCNEPNLMQTAWYGDEKFACAPWNDDLPALFKKMHGYDLFSILPYLFEGKSDTARRARIHYRQSVADLFTDSFARQIRLWCKEKGVKSSGHFLLNDYLIQHVQGYGDMMKFVSEFDVPALDIPIPNPNQFMSFRYQQSRFFSSVTAWKERDATLMLLDPIIGGYGKKRLSPDLPLLINSVNMASFHGVNIFTSYIPRTPGKGAKGYTKEQYRFLNEYSGRITQVLRGARREARVGLYYPIAMFQADLLASNEFWTKINAQHRERQEAWDNTEKALLNGDVEYMIVHPEGVADAKISEGRMTIGSMIYNTLVMPQLDFIPLAVAKQLQVFEKGGGTVIWADTVPRGAEHAKNDAAVNAILQNAKATPTKGVAQATPASFSSKFDLTFTPGTDQMSVGRFHNDDKLIYLLVNRLQKPISIEVKGSGNVHVLDPSTGRISSVSLPAKLSAGATRALILIPSSSRRHPNIVVKPEDAKLTGEGMKSEDAGNTVTFTNLAHVQEKPFVWEGVNPLVRHIRSADPDAWVWNDRVYVFASQDMPDSTSYGTMDGYHVVSSGDLTNWVDHGEILHSRDVDWGKPEGGHMWAPCAGTKNGEYYFYYPHLHKSDRKWRVGVATSDKPEGPYTDQGVVEGVDRNDPACFIDDDGQAYLYWGGMFKPPKMAKLKDNMIELAEEPRVVDYGGDNFCEGAFVFKREGKYYFTYFGTDKTGKGVQARYSVGDSPNGPFKNNRGFAKMPPGAQVHGSMIEFKGQWYYFYHLGNFTDANGIKGSKHRRNVCFDRMYFDEAGGIQLVEYTLKDETAGNVK